MQQGSQTGWYKDSLGNEFTTKDGKPPSGFGVLTTNANGTGRIGNGSWDGNISQSNPKAK